MRTWTRCLRTGKAGLLGDSFRKSCGDLNVIMMVLRVEGIKKPAEPESRAGRVEMDLGWIQQTIFGMVYGISGRGNWRGNTQLALGDFQFCPGGKWGSERGQNPALSAPEWPRLGSAGRGLGEASRGAEWGAGWHSGPRVAGRAGGRLGWFRSVPKNLPQPTQTDQTDYHPRNRS
jgi:hypothetical protein